MTLREQVARVLCEAPDAEHGDPDWTVYPRGMAGGYEQRWEGHQEAADAAISVVLAAVAKGEVDMTAAPWLGMTPTRELERRVDEYCAEGDA